jgi:Fe2+ transport system protein FeoA
MPSLDQLRVGQQASIDHIRGNDSLVQRLLEMGLLEGDEIRLRDYRLSLRRSEAARIGVSIQSL